MCPLIHAVRESLAMLRREYSKFPLDKSAIYGRIALADAGIAHPVERHLAKVEVASSSLVARSNKSLLRKQ